MSRIYQSVSSWIFKEKEKEADNGKGVSDPGRVKENDAPELLSDKKTDEVIEPAAQEGLIWRVGGGVYGVTTGAVGMGVSGVKWMAGKSYDAGAAVVSTSAAIVKKVPLPTVKRKAKDE